MIILIYISWIASFLVAVAAFWYPVNVLSLVLATAGLVLEFSEQRSVGMNARCMTVGRGVVGKQLLESLEGQKTRVPAARRVVMASPDGFNSQLSHHKGALLRQSALFHI